MANELNKFRFRNCAHFPRRTQSSFHLTHSLVIFLYELDCRFDDDIVEKTFHNSLRAVLCHKIKTRVGSSESRKPSVNKVPTDQANLADQFV